MLLYKKFFFKLMFYSLSLNLYNSIQPNIYGFIIQIYTASFKLFCFNVFLNKLLKFTISIGI